MTCPYSITKGKPSFIACSKWFQSTLLALLVFSSIPSQAYQPGMHKLAVNEGNVRSETDIQDGIAETAAAIAARLGVPNSNSLAGKSAAEGGASLDSLLRRNTQNGTPSFVGRNILDSLSGAAAKSTSMASYQDRVIELFSDSRDVFLLEDPANELRLVSGTVDKLGNTHLRFDQVYQGLPVWNNSLSVHFDGDGDSYQVNGRYSPTPSQIPDVRTGIGSGKAVEVAVNALSAKTEINDLPDDIKRILSYDGPSAEKGIWTDRNSTDAALAWKVNIRPNTVDSWMYVVDAADGSVLDSYNETAWQTTESATATDALGVERTFNVSLEDDVYYLSEAESNISAYDSGGKVISFIHSPVLISSKDNEWTDSIAVSAYANAHLVHDYYLNEFGRNGIDGDNGDLPVVIHYTLDGNKMDNAFWNGAYIAFGDAQPYAQCLDVMAHELTHGVIEYTVGLEYRDESGALNEAYADIMASMIDPDWTMGEDLPDGALRDISDPERFGLPAHMDNYQYLSLNEDYGGVHINMSIPSLAAYYMVEKIGRDKTADIWYHVLESRYISPRSGFGDMRLAAVRSAEDFFGEGSDEVAAVGGAFDAVGILEEDATDLPDDIAAVDGEQHIAFVLDEPEGGYLAVGNTVLETTDDIMFPVDRYVFTDSSSPVTVCRNGSLLMYVDAGSNIRMLDLETYEDSIVDNSSIWSSIKLSPNGKKLAATTVYEDSTLFVLDLELPENSKSYHLYTASTEGVELNTAIFADALDWSSDSSTVLYDAFHRMLLSDSETIEFWDVNKLDIESGIITRVKTPVGDNLQVGNPSYAETNDRFITCDVFSFDAGYSAMAAIDLYTQDMLILKETGTDQFEGINISHPKFSPDDSYVVYQTYNRFERRNIIYMLGVDEDHLTATGSEKAYFYGILPVWYAREDEPLVVDASDAQVPHDITLSQNSPNPFNPLTLISFALTEAENVKLEVYDILGRRVETLVDDNLAAGSYKMQFDGSDLASGIYFYRLITGDAVLTRKMMLMK